MQLFLICDCLRMLISPCSSSLSEVLPDMELKPNLGSDRAWVWNTLADFADGECKEELLAIRFANAESKLIVFIFLWQNSLFESID